MVENSVVPSRGRGIVAAVVACLLVVGGTLLLELMTEGFIWFRTGETLSALSSAVARETAGLVGREMAGDGSVGIGESFVVFNREGLFGTLDRLILLEAIVFTATIAVCRVWGFGRKRTIALVVLSVLAPVPLAVFFSGAFVGTALGLCESVDAVTSAWYWARDGALVFTCVVVALSWWVAAWLGDEELVTPTGSPGRARAAFTTSLCAAGIASAALGAERGFAALGGMASLAGADGRSGGVTALLAARWGLSAVLLLMGAAMLLFGALGSRRLVGWAWLAILAAACLGGGVGAAVPLLAAIVAAQDERYFVRRGLAARGGAAARVARREEQPVLLWIALLAAVLLWGAFVRQRYSLMSSYEGMVVLAHPAVFAVALMAVLVLGIREWRRIWRESGRVVSWSALLLVLAVGATGAYGVGAYHEMTLRRSMAAAEPYLERVRVALERVPWQFGSWVGTETGFDMTTAPLPANAILWRQYVDEARDLKAELQIIHGRDANDIRAYAPPHCYQLVGCKPISTHDAEWTVDTQVIRGVEYNFSEGRAGWDRPFYVASFFVAPNGQFVGAFEELPKDADWRGAAEIQVIIRSDFSADVRRKIVVEMLEAAMPALRTIANPQ